MIFLSYAENPTVHPQRTEKFIRQPKKRKTEAQPAAGDSVLDRFRNYGDYRSDVCQTFCVGRKPDELYPRLECVDDLHYRTCRICAFVVVG